MRLLYLVRHGDYQQDTLTDVGREQSRLVGARLAGVPFMALHHSTEQRAAETAELIAGQLEGVPVHPSDLLRECVPPLGEPAALTAAQTEFFAALPPQTVAEGPAHAVAAVERYAGPDGPSPELIVSHGNLINWFVANALGAPDGSWLRMLDYHCALTVLMYFPDRVQLGTYNDMGHLPRELRGVDYPPEFRI